MAEEIIKATVNGEQIELKLIRPTVKMRNEAQAHYNIVFSRALKSGALLQAKLHDYMVEQNLWDDVKDKRYKKLVDDINDAEMQIRKGGIKLKEARSLAIQLRKNRNEVTDLLSTRANMTSMTAEGQAEQGRFYYLLSCCLVYNTTEKPYFKNVEDCENNVSEDFVIEASKQFAAIIHNFDNDYENNLTENKFLKRFNFVNDDLQLVDENGNLIDEAGRRIDKDGYYINDEGQRIDVNGNLLNDKGEYLVDEQPFLDDDGNPIVDDTTSKSVAKPRRGRPAKK